MGKKKKSQKQTPEKTKAPLREGRPELQPPAKARPTVPPPPPQTSTAQSTPMVSIDALTAYLQQTNPNVDWGAALASLSQLGGVAPEISIPPLEVPPVIILPPIIPTSSNPTTTEPSPQEAAQPETSEPSPTPQLIVPLDVSPLLAYQDPGTKEEDATGRENAGEEITEEAASGEEGEVIEETPIKETVEEREMREERELNETARKQGLMTDEEFQSILDGVTWREENAAEMAEGLDLASKAVEDRSTPEPTKEPEEEPAQVVEEKESEKAVEIVPEVAEYKPVAEAGDEQLKEKEPEVPIDEPEAATPSVNKPKAVKRKLVLKNDPRAPRQKPTWVSQRCLGRGMTSKAGANTASSAVEISSEDEKDAPAKTEEKSLPADDQEDTPTETEVVPPTPVDQEGRTSTQTRDDTAEMVEGLDLASKAVGDKALEEEEPNKVVETKPTAQEKPSASPEKKPDDDAEEKQYLQERKRKGKNPVKPKQSSKKPRTASTVVVIREPERRDPPRWRDTSDDEYASSEESESESDVSFEDEEFQEHRLPENHRELVHSPVERLEYLPWEVELDDDLMEDMKHYNTKKLQDSFDEKEDNSKQIKCGKVLHFPSLDELAACEPFLSMESPQYP